MTQPDAERYGVVRLGDVCFGIPIAQLIEVFPVSATTALPGAGGFFAGGFKLRGQTLPLLALGKLAGLDNVSVDLPLGVVVENDGQVLAFRVQEIVGIAHVKSTDLCCIADSSSRESGYISFVFNFDGATVALIDVAAVFATPGVHATARADTVKQGHQSEFAPMMTFLAGEAHFAVPAIEVYAAVPRQPITASAMVTGPCLGEITYHNRRIPVLCPVMVLGIGKAAARTTSEILVLRFPGDQLLGLAVDAIHDIRAYETATKAPLPTPSAGTALIKHVYLRKPDAQIFAVDIEGMRAHPGLLEFASLSQPDTAPSIAGPRDVAEQPADKRLIIEQERYLIVETDQRLAVPLLQVSCILEPPAKLTQKLDAARGFKGFFSRLNQSVALVDLREAQGRGTVTSQTAKVLLTGEAGAEVGFLVDRVLSIEVSSWRERAPDGDKDAQPLVQLGSDTDPMVLPYCDLHQQLPADDLIPEDA
ncbi:MAG: chemotaxis protein CheW [Pseudomonadota bacterium]